MLRAGVLREAEEQLFVAAARAAAVHEVEHELRQAEARVRTRARGAARGPGALGGSLSLTRERGNSYYQQD